jgi:hypothetical protein
MNTIQFMVQPHREGDWSSGVRIIVDGQDLTQFVRATELPFASLEGRDSMAGKYAGLSPDGLVPPSKHFLGVPAKAWYDYDSRIQIMGCECGEVGCWPLVCKILINEKSVVWSDFLQPHRAEGRKGVVWSYPDLMFEFDRRQYESALAQMGHAV